MSKLTYHVSIALFLSIFALSSLVLSTPILFNTISDLELILETERVTYERSRLLYSLYIECLLCQNGQ